MARSRHWVALALTSGMPVFEASVPCEVFGIDRPDLVSPWYRFCVVGLGEGPVRIGPGFYLPCTSDCDALTHADTVVVPACADVHDDPPEQLVDAVRAAHERGALHWLLLQRVRRAQEMLETTSTPVEAVATACGFGTATNMRAHFKKHTGVSPAAYRRTFQTPFDEPRPEAVL